MSTVQELYDSTARRYDLRQSNPWTEMVRKKELELVSKHAWGKILDVGCGSGFHLEYLSKKGRKNLFGADVSIEMLRKAAERSPSCLARASAEHLPFADGSFDTVLCMFTVLNMCDYEAALREMARVLREGGRVILSAASVWDNYGKSTKAIRVENFRLRLELFEKKDLEKAAASAGLKLLCFDSLFRHPALKPRWGDFVPLADGQKELLEKEKSLDPEAGAVYFMVAGK